MARQREAPNYYLNIQQANAVEKWQVHTLNQGQGKCNKNIDQTKTIIDNPKTKMEKKRVWASGTQEQEENWREVCFSTVTDHCWKDCNNNPKIIFSKLDRTDYSNL